MDGIKVDLPDIDSELADFVTNLDSKKQDVEEDMIDFNDVVSAKNSDKSKRNKKSVDFAPVIDNDSSIEEYDFEEYYGSLTRRLVFDTHCHYDLLLYRLRLSTMSQYNRTHCARFRNLEGVISVFCDPLSWARNSLIDELGNDKTVYLAFGCHPKHAKRMNEAELYWLRKRLKQFHNVVAVGEIGLDYSEGMNSEEEKENQKEIFVLQLKLALEFKLPIVLHIRNAEDDGYAILKEVRVPKDYPIHRHCMNDTWEVTERWLKEYPGSKIGITPLVTYPNAKNVREIARKVPLDRLLLETDSPYFLPERFIKNKKYSKVKSSYPALVLDTAIQVSILRKEPLIKILEANRNNVQKVYNIQLVEKVDRPSFRDVACQVVRARELYVWSDDCDDEDDCDGHLYRKLVD